VGKAERLQYAEAYERARFIADFEDFLELVSKNNGKSARGEGLKAWRQRGGRPKKSAGKAYGRSKLTNVKDSLPDVNGRSVLYRRFKDIARLVAADQGGLDALSEARVQLVRRFAATCVMAEQIEADMCNGLKVSIERHTALSSTLVRLGARIGIDRRAKNVTPNLTDYLELQSAPDRIPDAPERADRSKGDE
jgi:hypothetical protein